MRVRIIKPIGSAYGGFAVGTVADVPAKVAKDWCKDGIAMQDKSLDGPTETKAESKATEEAMPTAVKTEDTNSKLAAMKSKLGK